MTGFPAPLWLRPTRRAIDWTPVTVISAAAVAGVAAGVAATVLLLTYRALALDPAVESELGAALVALLATGIAVHSVLEPAAEHSADAAAAAVLMWVGAGFVPTELIPEMIGSAWLIHPWAVAALAIAVILGTKSLQYGRLSKVRVPRTHR